VTYNSIKGVELTQYLFESLKIGDNRRRFDDNIKMYQRNNNEYVNRIELAQDKGSMTGLSEHCDKILGATNAGSFSIIRMVVSFSSPWSS
jgi:hypothetical protein